MAELIRMDRTGHTVLARWSLQDAASMAEAERVFHDQLSQGLLAMVSTGPGHAEQVRELPPDVARVILRRPIVGG